MKIRYTDGPARLGMGAAGTFLRGEFKDVSEEFARAILKKKNYPWEAEKTQPAASGKKE